jgi:two-component system sensor kinase FixL
MNTETHTSLTLNAQTLIDALPDATLIINTLGVIECANRESERLFGYSSRDLAGKKINFLFSDRDGEPLVNGAPGTLPVEVTALCQSGITKRARLVCVSIESSDPPRFVLSVRPQDLLQELQPRAMRMTRLAIIGDIAGSIAHELNQPLSAIANYAQAVKWLIEAPQPDSAEINESLKEIATQAVRAGNTLRKLRKVIQEGEAQREPTTLNDVMNEIKVLLATEARLRSVRIVFDLAPDLPAVEIDRVQIQQVILNLIRNAIEAMEHTPREQREIKLLTALRDDGQIEVSITDTGSGIDGVDPSRLMPKGLGLPISKTIVEAHEGALVYKPNEPRGACFSFHLPAAKGR